MPKKLLLQSCGAATLALGVALAAMPAFAGFQMVPSGDGTSSNSFGAEASSAAGGPEVVSPIVGAGGGKGALSSSEYPSAPSFSSSYPEASARDDGKVDLSTATISMAPSAANDSMGSGDIVHGFASDVPLTLALRQVLPNGYSFSIDPSVDMNTLVSYKGGKSWGETLKAMLTPVGLVSHEQGTVVTIGYGSVPLAEKTAQAPAMAAAPAPVPAIAPPKMVADTRNSFAAPMPSPASPRYASSAASSVPSTDVWTADRGDTLRKVLTNWCHRAGYELKWIAEYDYPVEASVRFNGGFEEAVRSLLSGFDGARPQPIGELHTSERAGQQVLVIQVRGNSYTN